ncbi:carboxypeptidase B [Drosophila subpulchrella]|uniref:carboxypeptidase B n=1 Tax=Drosophila subpulchrella TaxID=1486046 RepID=UPI0018A19D8B|nr:carboxypeptidase B [Drosophila subpulchrella]
MAAISKRNTQTAKDRSRDAPITPLRRMVIPRPDILHTYLEYKQINQYMEYLVQRYPHFVRMHSLGLTHEKREVRALEINWMNSDNVELSPLIREQAPRSFDIAPNGKSTVPVVHQGEHCRKTVFIEAGTHAREWITISTALNCIYQLTERYTRNIEVLRKLRFIIVPLVNPDGYEYSRTKNAKWRKNRRPHKSSKFVGTDCNRNYDIFWNSGPSKINRNTYKGECPFSEPETRAMRNMLNRMSSNLLFFLSLHSYGQSIMYPWGYCRDNPLYWRELSSLANSGKSAIKSYNGREYRTGSISCLTKRTIAGSVVDYVYGVLKVPMALVMELPSRELGFQPPVEMISQIGHESWYGIREMCKRSYDLRLQIVRENEPQLPRPPRCEAGNEGVATETLTASTEESTAAGGDCAKSKPKKKRAKRTVRATHDEILRIQKGFKASEPPALPEGIQALPAGLFPRQLEPRVPPVKRSGLSRDGRGGGDGVILTSHGKPPISSTMPLGVFL